MTILQTQFQHRFLVVRNIKHSIILGWDFLVANSAIIDTSQSKLVLDGVEVLFVRNKQCIPISCNALIAETIQVPPNCEMNIQLRIASDKYSFEPDDYVGVLI